MELNVVQVVEPGIDGVFRHVEGLVDYLLASAVRVHLAYSDRRGSDRLIALVRRVENSGGCSLNLKIGNAPCLRDVPAALALSEMLKQVRPSAIHAHSSKAGALCRLLFGVDSSKLFYTPNAYYGMGGGRRLKAIPFNAVERAFARTGTTINVSEEEAVFARRCLKVPVERQVTIANAVDTAVFRPPSVSEKAAVRRQLGLPEQGLILGSVWRLSFQKDPLTLLRSLRAFEGYFVHLGTGELAPEWEVSARELGLTQRIKRLEYLPDPASFYQALDGFVMTSRYEGLSFAVLEALATGLPLILSDAPGNRTFLNLGLSHVWKGSVGDPEAFVRAIAAWSEDATAGRDCNHRRVAEERFSFDACYGRVLDLYRGR